MTAYAGGKIVFTHGAGLGWQWTDITGVRHDLGTGATAYCVVPLDASGAGALYSTLYTGDNVFMPYSNSTTGWCRSISSFALGS